MLIIETIGKEDDVSGVKIIQPGGEFNDIELALAIESIEDKEQADVQSENILSNQTEGIENEPTHTIETIDDEKQTNDDVHSNHNKLAPGTESFAESTADKSNGSGWDILAWLGLFFFVRNITFLLLMILQMLRSRKTVRLP